jgi:diphthine synthase
MVLFLIGLGLFNEKDISVRGLELVKSSDFIYMEYYTSILGVNKETLEEFYGKKIILADREMVESKFEEEILEKAKNNKVALLVVGDPFSATTHVDLYSRAIKEGIKIEVLNNASIINSCGITGLSLYRFGEIISVPYFTKTWKPYSFYEKIKKNISMELHTLLLLDIRVKEINEENLCKGKKIYDPPRFMTVNQCLEQLKESEEHLKLNIITEDTKLYGLARIGAPDQLIISGTISELIKFDFGGPLHSVILIHDSLHSIEQEMYDHYNVKNFVKK